MTHEDAMKLLEMLTFIRNGCAFGVIMIWLTILIGVLVRKK